MRIAIIGAGIAGNGAAFALWHGTPRHDFVLFESAARIGGHSNTIDIDYDGAKIAVDTGFIVYNETNYPEFCALLAHLGIAHERSNMSFSLSLDGGRREWSGRESGLLAGLFAQKAHLADPSYWRFLGEIARFNRVAARDHAARRGTSATGPCEPLSAWLDRHAFSERLRADYLLPMAAAIWSCPVASARAFPAATLIDFFANHHLLSMSGPGWRTIKRGARAYVGAMTAPFRDRIRVSCPVVSVSRESGGVLVRDAGGGVGCFDHAILAVSAPRAAAMVADASDRERRVLAALSTSRNRAVLHRDPRLMPRRRAAWASWNVLRAKGDESTPVSVTYWMNSLQNLDPARPLFVTLNPAVEPDPALTFARFDYEHPVFDTAAIEAQRRLTDIQGRAGLHFAGAWTGNGFHEHGLVSGLEAARALGGEVPWAAGRAVAQPASERLAS